MDPSNDPRIREALDRIQSVEYELPEHLQPFYSTLGPLGLPMLNHKFYIGVVTPFLITGQPTPEDIIEQKQERAQEELRAGNLESYIWFHERPYRAEALQDILDSDVVFSESEFGSLCRRVWTDSENIDQNIDFWESMFESVPGSLWMTDEDHDALGELPETFRVYRGVCDDGDVSWTLSEQVAIFFANRGIHNSTGEVITQVIRKSDIFAYTDDRSEKEILLLP